jgi:hypothetical protein
MVQAVCILASPYLSFFFVLPHTMLEYTSLKQYPTIGFIEIDKPEVFNYFVVLLLLFPYNA